METENSENTGKNPVNQKVIVLPTETTTDLGHRKTSKRKLIYIAATVLLLSTVGGFFAAKQLSEASLPGQSLYPLKTKVLEELTTQTKMGTANKISYEMNRLEKRLEELTTLATDTGTSSPETLSQFIELVSKQTETVTSYLSDESSLTVTEKIDSLTKLSTISRGLEITTDNSTEFASINEQVGNIEKSSDEKLKAGIQQFIQSSDTETVGSYIEKQITYVSEHVPSLASGSDAQKNVFLRVTNTQEAIATGDLTEATLSIIKAKQAIDIDTYLWDSERGPKDGVLPEPSPMPEGS
jgi:hypothetical protein